MKRFLYLSRADVEQVAVDIPTMIGLLELAFREKAEGRVEMPPKPGIHTRPDAFIHAMPAYIPSMHSAGMKWVSGYPDNPDRQLPYISGLLILNDEETGVPSAVMDCTWLTAFRTGAATALAARYLARPDSTSLGVLGCGVQGRSNAIALASLFSLERIYAYDTVPSAANQYACDIAAATGVRVQVVESPIQAVAPSDLVVTAGPIVKRPTPVIDAGWLRPGTFASAVDFDSYWTPQAVIEIDKFATDDYDQFLYYKSIGYFQCTPRPTISLEELVTGVKPGREREDERALAMNLGLALDDLAIAPELVRRAQERRIGTWLNL